MPRQAWKDLAMLYRLVLLTGPEKGKQITVETAPMTIGRDPGCAVRVSDDEVAREHAILEHRPDGLFIRDLGSMNKILINSREVREARLKHGDVIELGRTRFLVQALVQAEVSAETARAVRRKDLASLSVTIGLFLLAAAAGSALLWRRYTRPPPPPAAAPAATRAAPKAKPPAARAASTGSVAEGPVTEEIRRMRQDLADIRESVRGLAVQQPPAPAVPPAGAPAADAPSRDALTRKVRSMLETAQRDIASNNLAAADQLLEGIQILDPAFLPAYEERARLFEQRGLLDEAIAQWSEIIRRSQGTPLYVHAVAERIRLGQARERALRHVRIAGVEQQKFPVSDEFDEMRVLNVALKPGVPGQGVETEAVRVDVTFFDEDKTTRAVHPTRAAVPKAPLKPEGAWAAGAQKSVSATYLVPRNFRSREALVGRDDSFYGYLVRVYYHGKLQDQDARPKTLLQQRAPAAPAAASTNQPPRTAAGKPS